MQSKVLRLSMMCLFILLGCAVIASSFPFFGGVDKKIPKLVKRLLKDADLENRTVGVGGVTGPKGMEDGFGKMIGQLIEPPLVRKAKQDGFRVIDRKNLEKIAAEWKLQLSGLTDSATTVRLGQIAGLDALIVGRYTMDTKHVRIVLTLLDTSTGRILSSKSMRIKKNQAIADLLSDDALSVPRDNAADAEPGSLSIKVWAEKDTYAIGETLTFQFRASQDCYVTLIDVGTSGKVTMLFPNHYYTDNFVEANKIYTIPPAKAGFSIRVDPPAGLELVRAIASKKPIAALRFMPSQDGIFAPIEKKLSLLSRDLNLEASAAPGSDWSESVIHIRIQ